MIKLNPYRHFYLYAKLHYKRTNVITDLKAIVADYCGFYKEDASTNDVIRMLLKITSHHINNSDKFLRFMDELVSRINFPFKIYDSPIEYIIDECLSILQGIKVIDIQGELGTADKNILPLKIKEVVK